MDLVLENKEGLCRIRGADYFLIKVPFRYSSKACSSSSSVFITIGPYQATGSSMGLPDMSRNRSGFSEASIRGRNRGTKGGSHEGLQGVTQNKHQRMPERIHRW